jgi:hypothetical protein
MFRPRVQAVAVGQWLEFRNSDSTTHNVHVKVRKLREHQATESVFNQAQRPGDAALRLRIFNDADVYELRCDMHAWMYGYLVISDNPYAAVTGEDGTFTIQNAPAGKFRVQAWHALYGLKEQEVELGEGKTVELQFSFDATADKPAKAG